MIFDTSDKMKFERKKDMCKLKREIMVYLFDYVARKPREQWWQYKGDFLYEGRGYNLECECKLDNQMFSYRNLFIEHKQEIIDLTNPEHVEKYFGKEFLQ